MADLNSCSFTGRLGRDVETRQTPGGMVASFTLAVGRKTKNGDETLWLRCSVFGKGGEVAANYLGKGSQVAVTGRLSINQYKDRDGIDRQSVDLWVNDFTMIGGRHEPAPKPQSAQTAPADFDEDVPF